MGQIEVYELLKRERDTGNESYFSVSEIEKLMSQNGFKNGMIKSVRCSVLMLYEYDYLESVTSGKWSDWKRLFRVKKVEVKK